MCSYIYIKVEQSISFKSIMDGIQICQRKDEIITLKMIKILFSNEVFVRQLWIVLTKSLNILFIEVTEKTCILRILLLHFSRPISN